MTTLPGAKTFPILGLKIFAQIFLQIFVQIFGKKIFVQIFAEKFAKKLAQIFYGSYLLWPTHGTLALQS